MTFTTTRRHFLTGAAAAALFAPVASFAAEQADVIYSGGPILTIDDANPRAEAVAVKGGRILAVGKADDVMKFKGANTRMVDLAGRTMLPGFVDPHGHAIMGGFQALSANLLAPPDGEVTDIASLVKTLKDWTEANKEVVTKANLIMGFGYDQSQLKELRAPTKEELDEVSRDIPVLLVHQSGHMCALNSKGLEVVGVTADTPNPPGGVIQRTPGSQEPNGVLEESAHFNAIPKLLGNVGPRGMTVVAKAGMDLWISFGYTTIQEGRSSPNVDAMVRGLAEAGELKVDVVAYADYTSGWDYLNKNVSRTYTKRFRIGGVKLTIDGSPQGFTAWRDRPYYDPVGNFPPAYVGYAAVTNDTVLDVIDKAYANNVQILVHSNGEASHDLFITGLKQSEAKHGRGDRRPVLIHGQFQREDQVDSFVELGVFPSLFPMHTFYWGDWHRDHTVGPILADDISPTGWYVNRGSRFSTHTDAPVAFPDTMRCLDATVTRRSRSGDIIGPAQRVDVMTALKAMTLWPAYQHFEEAEKGSIEVGKLADFVILTDDPTAVDPETIDQIRVAETIKEGVSVYAASPERLKRAGLAPDKTHPFSKLLTEMAVERDFRRLPESRQTPLNRRILANAPHNRGCVNAVMVELTSAVFDRT